MPLLLRNDRFTLPTGGEYRLLDAEPRNDIAIIYDLKERNAWPYRESYKRLCAVATLLAPKSAQGELTATSALASDARKKVSERAFSRIEPLTHRRLLLEPKSFWKHIKARAAELSCSPTTLIVDLRRYWSGGQTSDALLGRCPVLC